MKFHEISCFQSHTLYVCHYEKILERNYGRSVKLIKILLTFSVPFVKKINK